MSDSTDVTVGKTRYPTFLRDKEGIRGQLKMSF
jgi:hypothetical protein